MYQKHKNNKLQNLFQLKFNFLPSSLIAIAILDISNSHTLCYSVSKAPCFYVTIPNKYSTSIWNFISNKCLYVYERKRGGEEAFLSFRRVTYFLVLKFSLGYG